MSEKNVTRLPKTAPFDLDLAGDGRELADDADAKTFPGEKLYTDVNSDHSMSLPLPKQQTPGGFSPTIQTLKEHSGRGSKKV